MIPKRSWIILCSPQQFLSRFTTHSHTYTSRPPESAGTREASPSENIATMETTATFSTLEPMTYLGMINLRFRSFVKVSSHPGHWGCRRHERLLLLRDNRCDNVCCEVDQFFVDSDVLILIHFVAQYNKNNNGSWKPTAL